MWIFNRPQSILSDYLAKNGPDPIGSMAQFILYGIAAAMWSINIAVWSAAERRPSWPAETARTARERASPYI